MIVNKKEASLAPYARKEAYEYEGTSYQADIQNGDTITIKNAGEMVKNNFGGESFEFLITTRNGDKIANLNQSSINVLHDVFGADTTGWVGKTVKVLTKKDVVAGKKVIIAYFVTPEWSLNEYGELEKPATIPNTNVPYPQDEGYSQLSPDDVPFN